MSKNSEAVKRWRRNAKQRLIRAFGGSCCLCGYNRCDETLEFHHTDPTQKDTHWGAMRGSIKGWDTIVLEMSKCVMVCSNCHKEVHAGFTTIPDDAPRLDLEKAQYKKQEKTQYFDACPICGGEKMVQYKTCNTPTCKQTSWIRKVDWSKISVVELYNQHQSYEAVGDILGVSGAAVARQYKKVTKKQTTPS